MGTVPVPHTWVAGDDATSTVMQTLTDAILYLLGSTTSGGSRRPVAQPRQSVAQSLATSAAWTALLFDTEDVDYDNGHSTATNTDRYTAATTGWHAVGGGASYVGNATGLRGVRYSVNGTATNGSTVLLPAVTGSAFVCAARSMLIYLNAGDILRAEGFQSSGGALSTVISGSDSQPLLSVEWRSN